MPKPQCDTRFEKRTASIHSAQVEVLRSAPIKHSIIGEFHFSYSIDAVPILVWTEDFGFSMSFSLGVQPTGQAAMRLCKPWRSIRPTKFFTTSRTALLKQHSALQS